MSASISASVHERRPRLLPFALIRMRAISVFPFAFAASLLCAVLLYSQELSSPDHSTRKGFHEDPQLLDKLYAGRFDEIGRNSWAKIDLIAVMKAFQAVGFTLTSRENFEIQPGDVTTITHYLADDAAALLIGSFTFPAHPNFQAVAIKLEQNGGIEGEWAQTTFKNLVGLILSRANTSAGQAVGTPGPPVENPEYQKWVGFAPGASAVYTTTTRALTTTRKEGTKEDKLHEERSVRILESINGEEVVIRTLTTGSSAKEIRSRTYSGAAETKLPDSEVVELDGRKFECSKARLSSFTVYGSESEKVSFTETTWTNDNVPGRVVRSVEEKPYRFGGQLIEERALVSYRGGKDGDWAGVPVNLHADPEFLGKVYRGELAAVGLYNSDLVAGLRAFEAAEVRIKNPSAENPTAEQMKQINEFLGHPEVFCPGGWVGAHPNYQRTIAKVKETGGADGEWAQTTYKNLIRLLKERANIR